MTLGYVPNNALQCTVLLHVLPFMRPELHTVVKHTCSKICQTKCMREAQQLTV